MKYFFDSLSSVFQMGIYPYIIIGVFIIAGVVSVASAKMNKNSRLKWLEAHPGAVKVSLSAGKSVITQKELYASVVSGDAAIFMEKTGYVVYSMPGTTVLEVTYTFTRPGVLYRNVSTTWGPSRIELELKSGREYDLTFDKQEETFKLSEK